MTQQPANDRVAAVENAVSSVRASNVKRLQELRKATTRKVHTSQEIVDIVKKTILDGMREAGII